MFVEDNCLGESNYLLQNEEWCDHVWNHWKDKSVPFDHWNAGNRTYFNKHDSDNLGPHLL